MRRCLPFVLSVLLVTLVSSCHEGTKYTDGQQLRCDLSVRAGYAGGSKATKAIVVDGSTFTPVWKEDDAVAVFAYDKENNNQSIQIGTLKALSDGAETTLAGTLSFVYGDAVAGKIDMGDLSTGKLLFVTPGDKYSMMDQKGKPETLLEQNCFRTAESRVFSIDLEESVLSLESATLRFSTPMVLVKVTLTDWKGDPVAPARLVISAEDSRGEACLVQRISLFGGQTNGGVSVLADGLSSIYYAALCPAKSGSLKYKFTATAGPLTYEGSLGSLQLDPGHFYEMQVALDRTVDLSAINAGFVAQDRDVLKGTGTRTFSIANGAAVILSGVDLDLQEGITCNGSVRLHMAEGSVNNIRSAGTGILAGPTGSSLIISGRGQLYVKAEATAIGGTSSRDCGYIIIEDGTVTAVSGEFAGAGIGSGKRHACGDIFIRGGTVTAQGGAGAGIGSDEFGTCGNISITEGSVIARASERSAGIGTGDRGICGTITITEGAKRVEATKGVAGDQCIGTGLKGTCGIITIDGVTNPTPESTFEHFTSSIVEYRYVNDTWLLERR